MYILTSGREQAKFENEQDARLFGAAPDLLRACHLALMAFPKDRRALADKDIRQALDACLAAVQKAQEAEAV